ncbi:unnamed protein product [Arabidopsis thaliana]|uniref:(thale cress) hypothetical protein n=1 Tax=Arabidopsis thaliana TaxID=3702 RepID=A0A7G2E432_ARATH|nr:unnamed protein product [Arabidopsis thaliana]
MREGSKWNINRSGFCGMRSKKFDGFIDLEGYDSIALRLKGDGRCYISTIYTENWVNSPGQAEDNSWQAFVFAPKGNWYTAKVPLTRYLPTWKGNVIDAEMEMNPGHVVGMSLSVNAQGGGFIGAKSGAGDFQVEIDWIKAKWHPDRFLEEIEKDEAKMKFQSIQRAYSVLSDSNKRLLYDVGAYDSDDDETGMADFINEMVTLMAQTQSTGDESLEEFEELFQELLKDDVNQFKTRSSSSSCSQFSGTSTLVHCDDLSNSNDIPNKINGHDNYCCISSSKVGGPSTRFQAGNRRSKK